MTTPARIFLLILTFAVSAPAQTNTPTDQLKQGAAVQAGQVAAIDPAILEYGAALEAQASPDLKTWCQSYAGHRKMRKRDVDLSAIRAAVDEEYPRASAAAREGVAYLLIYTAYKRHSKSLGEIESYLGQRKGSDPFAGSHTPLGPSSRPGGIAWEQRSGSQWQWDSPEEQHRRSIGWLFGSQSTSPLLERNSGPYFLGPQTHVPELRERVDTYQRLLMEAHKQVGSTPPDVLREIP